MSLMSQDAADTSSETPTLLRYLYPALRYTVCPIPQVTDCGQTELVRSGRSQIPHGVGTGVTGDIAGHCHPVLIGGHGHSCTAHGNGHQWYYVLGYVCMYIYLDQTHRIHCQCTRSYTSGYKFSTLC